MIAAALLAATIHASSWLNTTVPVSDSDLRDRVVLLDFWAAWCTPCIRNLPEMQSTADAFKGRPFAIVGVHHEETSGQIGLYLRDQGVLFPVAIDTGATFKRFAISRMPTYVLIDKKGAVRFQSNEPPPREVIASLLGE